MELKQVPSSSKMFTGWGAFSADSIKGELKLFKYTPKPFEDDDVDIQIICCGICGSDIHTMSGGWRVPDYPQVVGHEIVGKVVRIGGKVSHLSVGDIVGVGAQCDSCGECVQCNRHSEQYCQGGMVGTYDSKFKRANSSKGHKTYGGYSDYHRCPARFAIKLPDGLDPALAAPMLCGGVTVYSPLVQNNAGSPDVKDVGIIGIGGLGHFGIMFAKALGANVTAISHSERKKQDAFEMGASHFISTAGKDGASVFKANRGTLDLIICTTNDPKMPLSRYVSLLRTGGKLIVVGIPEGGFPPLPGGHLINNNVYIGGSCIGSPKMIRDMFDLALKQNIKPWVEKRSFKNINQAIVDMHAGKAKYRYVLVNDDLKERL